MEIARFLGTIATFAIFLASQLFWIRQVAKLGGRLIASPRWREILGGVGAVGYILVFAYNFAWMRGDESATRLTIKAALLEAPFEWWVLCSLVGFAIVVLFWIADRLVRVLIWAGRRIASGLSTARSGGLQPARSLADNPPVADPPSPSRRRFLEQTAIAVSATPFVAGAYGLLYARLNLETTHQRIMLARLPKAFHGFRIAQLSDIHIGPFMSAAEVRKYVAITNELRPDLVVLTGDFINWDPATQSAVVDALAGLKAPFGIFGCLGNHELWSETESSISRLFAARGIRILRQANALVESHGEKLNLIGVDFQSTRRMGPPGMGLVRAYLAGVERLMQPDTANILLSHNPNTFDRAAELGIDLSLAGHTHGGQVNLEFIHRGLTPARLITDYIKGWFQKGDAQLYVNRGIGTFGVPIRFGSPPEITLFELVREG
jgi:predicted MPP superfamily phosphohydrolase